MKTKTEYFSVDGHEFGVLVRDGSEELDQYEEVGIADLKIEDFVSSSAAAIGRVGEMARSLAPDEFEIKLKLLAEVRNGKLVAVIVDGKAEASIELVLSWKSEKSEGN